MTDIEDIANRTAAGIALAYRSGEAGPVELTECLLDRIAKAKGDNVFITVTAARARLEAKKAQGRYEVGAPLSPLDGVPIAWKDIFDVAGTPTTAGSRLLGGGPAKTADHACVANAAAAGMVSVGKLNMSELAYSGLGLNPHFGMPINPNDRKTARSPGGSSSGCGAAVAGGLVPCAIGSDTGGSVRIPAAFNGVVGYKTSTGRIDANGLVPLARTFDTIGPLARSVEDCILLDTMLRGAVTTPVRHRDLGSLTLLAPKNVVFNDADAAVLDNFERSLEALAHAGVSVRRERVETFDEILEMTARYGTLTAAEAYNEYRDIMESDKADTIDRRVIKRIMDGKRMSADDVLSIQRGRTRLIPKFLGQLGAALLVMPTTPITAPDVAPLEVDDELFHKINLRTLRNTMLGNILDLCGVAMPNGRDGKNMPTSVLISAGHGDDDRLLGYALEIERIVRAATH
ncbi:amidase family protein [Aminobacter sp. MSH1]|uniref:amidase family protein n=1 Tax=Aminobacter sp. MSH1 TaxID=374606 RepID=UPI000D3983D6|nr:amidase family protein [Aminobacter sp. MSH1]